MFGCWSRYFPLPWWLDISASTVCPTSLIKQYYYSFRVKKLDLCQVKIASDSIRTGVLGKPNPDKPPPK